jgi:hypothetical protein
VQPIKYIRGRLPAGHRRSEDHDRPIEYAADFLKKISVEPSELVGA